MKLLGVKRALVELLRRGQVVATTTTTTTSTVGIDLLNHLGHMLFELDLLSIVQVVLLAGPLSLGAEQVDRVAC